MEKAIFEKDGIKIQVTALNSAGRSFLSRLAFDGEYTISQAFDICIQDRAGYFSVEDYYPEMRESIVDQARTLASGTIASCTGFHYYVQTDAIRPHFIDFCQENEKKYATWGDAWNMFIRVFILTEDYRKIAALRPEAY